MTIRKSIMLMMLPFTVMAAFSCTELNPSMEMESNLSKITNTPENVCQESILIQVTKGTGIESLQGIEGIASVERIFPDVAGTEEKAAEFGLDRWYKAFVAKGSDIETAARNAAELACIEKVEYNAYAVKASTGEHYPYTPGAVTKADGNIFNDPALKDQWHYINNGDKSVAASAYAGADINVKDVWDLITGDESIIVAVVDEGVKHSHPDLNANMWVNTKEVAGNGIDDDRNGYVDDIYGYNFIDNGPITWTKKGDSGHGTHIAGTIAAVNNNNLGVVGIAGGDGSTKGVKIMSCQIHSGSNGATGDVSAKAIRYAADMGASILQCSWGYPAGYYKDDNTYATLYPLEYAAIRYFESTTPSVTTGH